MNLDSSFTVQGVGPGRTAEGIFTPHFLNVTIRSLPPEAVFSAGPATTGDRLSAGKLLVWPASFFDEMTPSPDCQPGQHDNLIAVGRRALVAFERDIAPLEAFRRLSASLGIIWGTDRRHPGFWVEPSGHKIVCQHRGQEIHFPDAHPLTETPGVPAKEIMLAGLRAVVLRTLDNW